MIPPSAGETKQLRPGPALSGASPPSKGSGRSGTGGKLCATLKDSGPARFSSMNVQFQTLHRMRAEVLTVDLLSDVRQIPVNGSDRKRVSLRGQFAKAQTGEDFQPLG